MRHLVVATHCEDVVDYSVRLLAAFDMASLARALEGSLGLSVFVLCVSLGAPTCLDLYMFPQGMILIIDQAYNSSWNLKRWARLSEGNDGSEFWQVCMPFRACVCVWAIRGGSLQICILSSCIMRLRCPYPYVYHQQANKLCKHVHISVCSTWSCIWRHFWHHLGALQLSS